MTTTLFPDAVITGELLERLRLPDVPRYELVEGRIEPVTPTNLDHAEALVRIGALLRDRMPGWRVLGGDPGVYVRRTPDTVRGPDVVAISEARYQQRDPARAFLTVVPELVVEITSPRNAEDDIARKVAEYLGAGATVVWVVNLDDLTVTVTDRTGLVGAWRRDDRLILPNGAEVSAAEVVG